MRVLWALEELGLEYIHHSAAPRSEQVRALNPLGKIPILVDGDAVLTDSTAILTYLADKHGRTKPLARQWRLWLVLSADPAILRFG